MALLTSAFDKIEIRTAFTDPITIDLRGPPDPKTRALLEEIRPAVILRGPLGQVQIAPLGIPTKSPFIKRLGWGVAVGGVGAALGLVFLGAALGRRR